MKNSDKVIIVGSMNTGLSHAIASKLADSGISVEFVAPEIIEQAKVNPFERPPIIIEPQYIHPQFHPPLTRAQRRKQARKTNKP